MCPCRGFRNTRGRRGPTLADHIREGGVWSSVLPSTDLQALGKVREGHGGKPLCGHVEVMSHICDP